MSASIQVNFYGASGCVTGSRFEIVHAGKRLLVDCGLFQGPKELRKRNWEEPPFRPDELDAILLTHAHIDHTGYLPLVVKRGFRGPVYCTAATKELLELLLPDSAELQVEQARYYNKHKLGKHKPTKPLYDLNDAKQALKQLKVIERDTPKLILPKWSIELRRAGHILGACSAMMEIDGRLITFSGDIGKYGSPILPDPGVCDFGDLLLCESTYGDRLSPATDVEKQLVAAVKQTVDRRGPLIIPAFAIGRTQTLIYHLAKLEREGKIPVLPVYIDSPMAVDATQIYRRHKHDFDDDSQEILAEGNYPLLTDNISFCRSSKESKSLNSRRGPRVIISASGMLVGGRVLHHLKQNLSKEETTLLFVGYQAEGTRGRDLIEGEKIIKIFGKEVEVRADIKKINGLSAHGDKNELLKWISQAKGSAAQVKVIHGEKSASESFANTLKKEHSLQASAAKHMETVEI